MKELYRIWGGNIAIGRRAAGYATQEALAEALDVRQSTVQRWEAGSMAPRDEMKIRIARLLGQDVRVLFPLTRSAA